MAKYRRNICPVGSGLLVSILLVKLDLSIEMKEVTNLDLFHGDELKSDQ